MDRFLRDPTAGQVAETGWMDLLIVTVCRSEKRHDDVKMILEQKRLFIKTTDVDQGWVEARHSGYLKIAPVSLSLLHDRIL